MKLFLIVFAAILAAAGVLYGGSRYLSYRKDIREEAEMDASMELAHYQLAALQRQVVLYKNDRTTLFAINTLSQKAYFFYANHGREEKSERAMEQMRLGWDMVTNMAYVPNARDR